MAKIKNKKNSLTKKKMRGKIMIMIITEKKAHCHLSVEDDDDFLFLTLLIFRRKQKKPNNTDFTAEYILRFVESRKLLYKYCNYIVIAPVNFVMAFFF